MTIATKYAATLAQVDAATLLKAMTSTTFMADPGNLADLKSINGASEEMDRAGPLGLTVAFKEIRTRSSSEGLAGKLFGKRGNFYIVATALDGSTKPFEYKTQFFQGIGRKDRFPLGDGGMLVSYIEDPRWFIDLHMIVMESDSDYRNLGAAIDEARKEVKLDDVVGTFGAALAFDPTGVLKVLKAVDMFGAALAYILKKNGDDHVATVHDFYLEPQAFGQGRHPSSGVQPYQKVDVAYEIDLTPLTATTKVERRASTRS